MKIRLLAVLVLVVSCGPIPGGSLAGMPADVPADWSTALEGDRALCEVESRPANPHSIQLECFLHDGSLYVQSHRFALAPWWPVKSWAAVWLEDPDVRVRVGDALYDLKATQVSGKQERDAVLVYRGYDPVPAGIVLFRFEPRS